MQRVIHPGKGRDSCYRHYGSDELEINMGIARPKVKNSIAASRKDYAAGKTRPAGKLLAELKRSAFGRRRSYSSGVFFRLKVPQSTA